MARRAPRAVGRAADLVASVATTGSGAFVCDTGPLVCRLERGAAPGVLRVCDGLFTAVEEGALSCLVSAVAVAELLIRPFRAGPVALSLVDRFLRQPALGIVEVNGAIAIEAAYLVAQGRLGRLADALIAATALDLGLPLVTGDRRLARSGVVAAFYLGDYAA